MHVHHPFPHLKKRSAQKRPKEERKFRPDILAKRMHVPLRYNKIKTKKLGEKEEESKKKGIKQKKERNRITACRK